MPIIKSAKKRVKLAAKAHARNNHTRRSLRAALRSYSDALEGGKAEQIMTAQKEAFSAIDTAAKKFVIHRNKAARIKSRLSAQAKIKGVKPSKTARSATPAKAAAKKPAAKKTTTKKSSK